MILRVPDYYEEFSCIAGDCRHSCCIGWEIDIDEDTYAYYKSIGGALGERLATYMYMTEDNEHSFQLESNGYCPFLNKDKLCDICIALGEEALSEVCTEYPRFSIEYGNVLQKCLSLSCEEVGRILFFKDALVQIVDHYMPDDTSDADEPEDEWIPAMEQMQKQAIALLQDRSRDIWTRMREYLLPICEDACDAKVENDSGGIVENAHGFRNGEETGKAEKTVEGQAYQDFKARYQTFAEMETLDEEWEIVKAQMEEHYTAETYAAILQQYLQSPAYRESDYEQLMVYFTFRYLMNAVYDYDAASYRKLAVVFTLFIRDMDALRYHLNGGCYTRDDRVDVVRIFSKEVEHSEENIELAREAFLFEEVYETKRLMRQI